MKIRIERLVPVPEVCPLRMGLNIGQVPYDRYCHECEFNKNKPNVIAWEMTTSTHPGDPHVLTKAYVDCAKMDEIMEDKKILP